MNASLFKCIMLRAFKPKFNLIPNEIIKRKGVRILDVGVANDSVRENRIVYNSPNITGLDCNSTNAKYCDNFFEFNLDENSPLPVADKYDIVICNHVLEHVYSWRKRVAEFCELLNPGGFIFIEFPNVNSLKRKRSSFSYHFHDDSTHVSIINDTELANILLQSKMTILSSGYELRFVKFLNGIVRLPLYLITGRSSGGLFAASSGKITSVLARKSY